MNEQQRKTLSRSLFILSGVIIVIMIGLGILGMFTDTSEPNPSTPTEQQAPDSQAPTESTTPDDDNQGILGQIWGFVLSIWNFFGRVGLIAQLLCCIVVPLMILAGIAADKPL